MLSRTNRFHGHNSLNWAYRHGATIRDSKMSLKYAANQRRRNFRAAVVVSRKVSKSAVVRNRIRRRIYEILRSYSQGIDGGQDLIFMVYSADIADMPQSELEALVKRLLTESKTLSR